MVVVALVLDDVTAPEHLLEEFEGRPGRRRLGDRELVLDLPAEEAPGIAQTMNFRKPSRFLESSEAIRQPPHLDG